MNHPQHVFDPRALTARESSSSSIEAPSIVLYPLPQQDGVPTFDARRIGKARSSWALYSRVNRMKKRHAPPAAKSFPGTESCSKRTRKSSKTNNSGSIKTTTPKPIITSQSRWESLPPSPCSLSVKKPTSSSCSSSLSSSSSSRGSGRPTLPKRQKSLESSDSRASDAAAAVPRKAKLNQAAADKALRSFRRSFQTEARKALFISPDTKQLRE